MKQASTLEMNNMIQYLESSELKFFLATKDTEQKTIVDLLRENVPNSHHNIQIIDENGMAVKISIFLLGYNYTFKGINTTIERHDAVKLLFVYWQLLGEHKARTKDPYKCREFMKFLDSINFTEADYLIIGKP